MAWRGGARSWEHTLHTQPSLAGSCTRWGSFPHTWSTAAALCLGCRSSTNLDKFNETRQGGKGGAGVGDELGDWDGHTYTMILCIKQIGLPRWLSSEDLACQCRRHRFDSWVRKIFPRKICWRRKWQPTPVFLPGKHGQRSLAGYSPWGHKELDTTEHAH